MPERSDASHRTLKTPALTDRLFPLLPRWLIPGRPLRAYADRVRKFRKHGQANSTPLDTLLTVYRNGPGKPVLFLGDSSVIRTAREDTDRRRTGEMLAAELGEGLICFAPHTAYSPLIYRRLVEILPRLQTRPKLILLPLNLRSFSATWYANPCYRFPNETKRIKAFLADGNPAEGRAWIESLAEHLSFLRTPFAPEELPFSSIGDYVAMTLRKPRTSKQYRERKHELLASHYMGRITPDNPTAQALQEMIKVVWDCDVRLLLYVTPVNRDAGLRFCGPRFAEIVQANVSALHSLWRSSAPDGSGRFLDLSLKLDENSFFSKDETTEHLNQQGRQAVAATLLVAVRATVPELETGHAH